MRCNERRISLSISASRAYLRARVDACCVADPQSAAERAARASAKTELSSQKQEMCQIHLRGAVSGAGSVRSSLRRRTFRLHGRL